MLRVVRTSDGGRAAVAACDVAAGTVVFAEEAYCVSPAATAAASDVAVCVYCSARVCLLRQRPFRTCEACGSVYCSAPCWAAHAHAHTRRGECAALRFVQRMHTAVPREDLDTLQMVCLVLARGHREDKSGSGSAMAARLQRVHDGGSGASETVGAGRECADPAVFCAARQRIGTAARACYEHVECLATNITRVDAAMLDDFARLHTLYTRWHRRCRDDADDGAASLAAALPADVSRDVFVALCCAFLCNGFGVWDSRGRKRATALFAQSAYFNHSCLPNVARRHLRGKRIQEFVALRDVACGEALCIAYVDPRMPRPQRQARLRATYAFDCACERCASATGDAHDDSAVLCASTSLRFCDDCVSGTLHPVRDWRSDRVTHWRCALCDATTIVA